MGDRSVIGIGTIVVGLLLVIGALRGTWGKIFSDVVTGASVGPTPEQPQQQLQTLGQTPAAQVSGASSGAPLLVPPMYPTIPTGYLPIVVGA